MSSSLAFASDDDDVGISGKSNGTLGKLDKSSKFGCGAVAEGGGGGDIFARGCGFGVLFKFCKNKYKTHTTKLIQWWPMPKFYPFHFTFYNASF